MSLTSRFLLASLLVSLLGAHSVPAQVTPSADAPAPADPRVQNFLRLPVAFERQGSGATERYVAAGPGYSLGVRGSHVSIGVVQADRPQDGKAPNPVQAKAHVFGVEFLGAGAPVSVPDTPLPGRVNRMYGKDRSKWQLGLPTYGRVSYKGLYPGIDVVYYGTQSQLEFDLIVKPGADPKAVRMKVSGARAVTLTDDGGLTLTSPEGDVKIALPHIYQQVAGMQKPVGGRYRLHGANEVAFEVDRYDRALPLVIDPTITYSVSIGGGTNSSTGQGIAVDSQGNMIVAGFTNASDFPTVNPAQTSVTAPADAFITKVNAAGTALVYSSYLGGTNSDFFLGVALDSTGAAWAAGYSQSSDFPTLGASQSVLGGQFDAVAAKFSATGVLLYSTYLGGSTTDFGYAVAVDASDNAYIAGLTNGSFPTTSGAYQTAANAQDAFVVKLNSAGVRTYSTLLGGSGSEGAYGIAADSAGNAYVTGWTFSSSFPGTPAGGAQAASNGAGDAFVAKLNPTGTGLVYMTFLGGQGYDQGNAIALDGSLNAYIAGQTSSTGLATAGAPQSASGGGVDGFIAKLNASGSAFGYITYFGGTRTDRLNGVAVDAAGNVWVAGVTQSSNGSMINPVQASMQGNQTALYRTTDSAGTWAVADGSVPGQVFAISPAPSGDSDLVISTDWGIFRSSNGGSTWSPGSSTSLGNSYIARSPVNSSVLYLVGSNGSFMRSSDGGSTWTNGGNVGSSIFGIQADPLTASTVYVFNRFSGTAIFKSTDSGSTWTSAASGLPSNGTQVYGMAATTDGTLYAAYYQSGIYKSTNQGSTWVAVNTGLPSNPTFSPRPITARGNTVYFAWGPVYKTTDGGANWTQISNPNMAQIAASPANTSVLYGLTFANTVVVSSDGGSTWSAGTGLGPYVGAFNGILTPSAATAGTAFVVHPLNNNAYAGKLNPDGTPAWTTYLGGFGGQQALAVSLAPGGMAMTGTGGASGFPLTAPGSASLPNGTNFNSAFITKISDATATCSVTLLPGNQTVSPFGTTQRYSVVAPTGCAWTAVSNQAWATVFEGASGTGVGIVGVQVSQNSTGSTRTASITVGSQVSTITQADSSCNYTLDQSVYNVLPGGGTVTASLTTGAGCAWALVNNYPGNVTITSASSGTGSAVLTFTVAANHTNSSRTLNFNLPNRTLQIAQGASGLPTQIQNSASLGTVSKGSMQLGLVATGGDGIYVWSLTAGTLPPGISLRTDIAQSNLGNNVQAALMGVATTVGTYNFTLSATSGASTATQAFTLRISPLSVPETFVGLPDGFVGSSYSYTFATAGAQGPVTFTPSSLPSGFSLSAAGVLTGTPSTNGNFAVNFSVSDGTDTIFRSFSFDVFKVNLATPRMLPNATVGTAYSFQLAASGGTAPYTYTSTCCGTSTGLNLSSSGLITGTPTGNGTFSFSVTVTDSANNSYFKLLMVDVMPQSPSIPQVTVGNVEDIPVGGAYSLPVNIYGGAAPFTLTATGLPPGMSIRTAMISRNNYTRYGDGEIWGNPSAAGTYNIQLDVTDSLGATASAAFVLRVSQLEQNPGNIPNPTLNAAYNYQLRILGGVGPYTAKLITGNFPSGLTLNPTTLLLSGTPVENGNFQPVVEYKDANGLVLRRYVYMFVGNGSSNVTINSNADLGARGTGTSYSNQLFACCAGSYTWSQVSGTLPPGLTLSSGGLLSGTVGNTVGTYTFLVKVADSSNSANAGYRMFTMVVSANPVVITTNGLPYLTLGSPYSQTLAATGGTGALTWSVAYGSNLPPGITLSSGGVLSGTPTGTGAFNFGITATDTVGLSATNYYYVQSYGAGGPPLSINNNSNLGTFTTGELNFGLGANGATGTYTWTFVSGTLPTGLALRTDTPSYFASNSQAGLIGVATTPGDYTFTLTVTSGGQTATRTFTMRITSLGVRDQSVGLLDGFVSVPYTYAFGTVGATGTATYTANNIPSGFQLSSAGVLTGTPTAAGQFPVNFNVTDNTGTISRFFTLNVYAVNVTSPGLLPNATQGVAYSTSLSATGGAGGYTWSVSNGSLPNGLTLGADGTISGTPNSSGQSWFYAKATDSAGASYSKNLSIVVTAVPAQLPALQLYGTLDDAVVGNGYNKGFNVCCGGTAPFTWTISGLPAGMSSRTGRGVASMYVESADVEIFGIPQVAGTYNLQVSATDANGVSVSNTYPFNVSVLNTDYPSNPTINTPYTMPFRPRGGTGPYTVQLVSGQLPAGLTLDTAKAVISGTPTENGNFGFTLLFQDSASHTLQRSFGMFVAAASQPSLTINDNNDLGTFGTGSSYSRQFSACCTGSYSWSLFSGALPTGTNLTSGGLLSGTLNTAGTYTFMLKVADAANAASFGLRQFRLVVSAAPLFISTSSLPNGTTGTAYSQALAAGNVSGTATWSLQLGSYLPQGLTLSSAGLISGTPTATGKYLFTVEVKDGSGTVATRFFSLLVYGPSGAPLTISTGANIGTVQTGPLQIGLAASGGTGTYAWSLTAGTLPPGMLLRTDTPSFFNTSQQAGLIGVATTPGNYSFTLAVTSGGQTGSQQFTMRVTSLNLMDGAVAEAFVGVPYSYTFTPVGAKVGSTVTFTQTSTAGAVNVNPQGVLAGTPTAAGSPTITFTVTDGTDTITKSFTLNTYAVGFTTPRVLPNGTQNGGSYSVQLGATGGTPAYTYSLNGGSLPTGLNLSGGGLISGTITAGPGVYTVNIKVADSNNVSYTGLFALYVTGTPSTLPRIIPGQINDPPLGTQFTWGLGVSGGGAAPFTYTATGLPPGMALRQGASVLPTTTPGSIELWGVPQVLGIYPVTLTVTDTNGLTTTNGFTMVVSPMQNTPVLPGGTVNTAYSASLRIIGGTPPYNTVYIQPGAALPVGLSLSGSTVSGTPGERGSFRPAFRFTDSTGATLTTGSSININAISGASVLIASTANLGQVGTNTSYTNQLSASAPSGTSVAWALSSGTLPPGINLSAGGLLSGTPTTPGSYLFKISAADATNSANIDYRQFTLVVTNTPITISTPTVMPFANLNAAYNLQIVATGGSGALTYSLNPFNYLPAGLSLSSGGVISGTPTQPGQFFFAVTVTDASGDLASRGFTLNVYPAGQCPPLFLSTPLSGNFGLVRVTTGLAASGGCSSNYTYSLTPGATAVPGMRVQSGAPLPTNFNASVTGGYLGVLSTPGSYTTSIRVTDGVTNFDRQFSFNVLPFMPTTQTSLPKALVNTAYTATVVATGGTGNYVWTLSSLPSALSGFTISSSGQISGTPTASGTFNFTVNVAEASAPSATLGYGFSLIVNPFAITNNAILPSGAANVAYSNQFSAPNCGTGCTWSASGLPGGLSLSSAGLLSGTVTNTAVTNTNFSVTVTGSNGTVSKQFSIYFSPTVIQALSITNAITTSVTLGSTASLTFSAAGGSGPYTYSVATGTLPPGLSLQAGDNLSSASAAGFTYLAGRAAQAGTYNFTIQVTDGKNATATKAFTYIVSPMSVEYTSLPISGNPLIYNTAYTQPILVIGGSGSYTSWTSAPSPVYPGLAMNASTGVVTGTPTNTGSVTDLITVTDSAGAVANTNVSFNAASNATTTVSLGAITTTTIPLGALNTFNLNPSGGTAPYTISPLGALPAGVSIVAGNAVTTSFGTSYALQVTPQATGTITFTLQVTDANNVSGYRTYSFIVPDFTSASTGLVDGSVGVPYSHKIVSFGSPNATWALASGSAMAPGLSVSPAGVISGTPTTAGTYIFNLVLSDASGSFTFNFTHRISSVAVSSPLILPAVTTGFPYNYSMAGTVAGGGTITWTAANLPSGLSMSTAGVITGTTNLISGVFAVTITATDGVTPFSRLYQMNVRTYNPGELSFGIFGTTLNDAIVNQFYAANINPTGGTPPYSITLASGSSLPTGMALLTGAAVPTITPGVTQISGAAATPGQYTFDLVMTDSAGVSITRTFKLNVTPINIVTGNPPTAITGTPYSYQFVPTGGTAPYSFSAEANTFRQDALPTGLTLSSSGLISGTATSTGSFSFRLTVQDSTGKTLLRTLTLNSTNSAGVQVNTTNPTGLYLGLGNVQGLNVSGSSSTFTWTVAAGTLPPGLSISPTAPLLQGRATVAGAYTYTLRATDNANSSNYAERIFTTNVSPMQLVTPPQAGTILVTQAVLPIAEVGKPYSYTFKVVGGTAPYKFEMSPFAPLPAGLTLSNSGVLSGTPQVSGQASMLMVVTDATGASNSLYVNRGTPQLIIVRAGQTAPLVARNIETSDPSVGQPFLLPLDEILYGGKKPFTWALTSGSLPPGLSILPGSNGVSSYLGGIPSAAGANSFQLTATDANGTKQPYFFGQADVQQVSLNPRAIPHGKVGTAYSVTFTAGGGTGPYTIDLDPTWDLPVGLSLSNAGVLSGTPTSAGVYSVHITATDNLGFQTKNVYQLLIDNANGDVPAVTLGPDPITKIYNAGGPAPTVSLSVGSTSGALPFTLAASGIGGTLASTSGTTSTSVDYTLNTAGLANGSYFGVVGVSAPGTVNGLAAIPVVLTVGNGTAQTITFTQPADVTLSASPVSLSATATSNLLVTFTSNTPTVCSVAGSLATLLTTGTCSVTANQSGDATFAAASPVTRTFLISPNAQTITFTAPADVALTAGPVSLTATASSNLTVAFTSGSTAICTVSGTSVTLVSAGTCSITANQAGNSTFAAATAVTRTFVVLKGSQTISFTQPADVAQNAGPVTVVATATSGLAVSFASNSTSVCTVSGTSVTLLATGNCSITASQTGNANYNAAASVTKTFAVTTATTATTVTLALGDGSGFSGDTVEIPITVTSTGTPALSTWQLDLNFDRTKMTFKSARVGAQMTAAEKSLSANTQPNGDVRLLAFGLNQNAIPNGIVAYASFTLSAGFTATPVTPKGCTAADGNGSVLGTACTAGTIKPPTCDVNNDNTVNVVDVQLIINEVLGVITAVHDLNHDGAINVADVQKVINAALGLGCPL